MSKFRLKCVSTISLLLCLATLALPASPVAAAAELSHNDSGVGNIHWSGVASFGGNTSPVMSTNVGVSPYAYGGYTVGWTHNKPAAKTIKSVTMNTYQCPTKDAALNLCTRKSSFPKTVNFPRASTQFFAESFGSAQLHRQWMRPEIMVIYTDNSLVKSTAPTRFYIHDGARNEIPTASDRGADNASVPQNTAMTMTFNQWSGLDAWNAGATEKNRTMRVYQCPSRPTDAESDYVSTTATPTGCSQLATNALLEAHDNQAKELTFTSGEKGSFIYAIDTLSFNYMPTVNDTVYLQKRAIYSTYDPGELPTGPTAGTNSGVGANPTAGLTPLQTAGINTTSALVVAATKQVTVNGATMNISSNSRYTRSTTRRTMSISIKPNSSAAGTIKTALVRKKDGVDFVYRKASKTVRRGTASWKWRMPTSFPRGKYKIYVTFTPNDTSLSPVTLTKTVRLR